jgi:hypothetical protein
MLGQIIPRKEVVVALRATPEVLKLRGCLFPADDLVPIDRQPVQTIENYLDLI